MSINENTRPGDVLKVEAPNQFSRKQVTITHAQTIVVGQLLENNGSDEYQALSAAVNEVQTVAIAGTLSAGGYSIRLVDKDGKIKQTSVLAYGANQAAVQAALDAVTAANAIVAGGTVPTAMTLTFSGTNYAGKPQTLVEIIPDGLTGLTSIAVTRTTAGKIAGAGAECVALESVTTGADPELKPCAVVFRDAVLDKNFLTYGSNITTTDQKTAIDAVLAGLRMDVKTSV